MTGDYQRMGRAIEYLVEHRNERPSLAETASYVGLSETHFLRTFRRWAGVTPKRFLQYLTLQRAKDQLHRSDDLLDATYQLGLSSPSRLHDLFVSIDAVTPGEYRSRGDGLVLTYGYHETPLGRALLVSSERGICVLDFCETDSRQKELAARWPEAEWVVDEPATRDLARRIFEGPPQDLLLHLRGTNFQLKVWEALLRVPEGHLVSYSHLAQQVGNPRGVRAVASAVAANPVAVLIPCHRVIRRSGEFGQYRWGQDRKLALIGLEAARAEGMAETG